MYGFNYLQFRFDIIVTSYVNKMNGQRRTDTHTFVIQKLQLDLKMFM